MEMFIIQGRMLNLSITKAYCIATRKERKRGKRKCEEYFMLLLKYKICFKFNIIIFWQFSDGRIKKFIFEKTNFSDIFLKATLKRSINGKLV